MNNPQFFTFGQVEREFQIAKSTLSKDRKSGKLSAEKQEDGSYRVALSELLRAYGDRLQRRTVETGTETVDVERLATLQAAQETAILKVQLEARDREIELLEQRISDLAGERDAWRVQAERATRLLEDQRERPIVPAVATPETPANPPEKPPERGFRLFGLRITRGS
jgi:hypothetical protein